MLLKAAFDLEIPKAEQKETSHQSESMRPSHNSENHSLQDKTCGRCTAAIYLRLPAFWLLLRSMSSTAGH